MYKYQIHTKPNQKRGEAFIGSQSSDLDPGLLVSCLQYYDYHSSAASPQIVHDDAKQHGIVVVVVISNEDP